MTNSLEPSWERQNRLLNLFSDSLYERLAPQLTPVSLSQGTILHYPGETIHDLYFPIDCLISITTTMKDGSTAETGLVGNREIVGINAFMGGRETTQTEYVVQIAGRAIKIAASLMRKEFENNKELRDLMLRYTQALIAQIFQTTACNRLHFLEQRLARWLPEAQDRIDLNELKLTQEFISHMLGVRRAGVTQAAQQLQELGYINYNRGRIQILDQQGLEETACECFLVVRDEYDRLLGDKCRS
ncbi:MAG: Crp/Fnr family transcriptional regulator [Cyanophyceae cyanobacterium]